VTSALLADARAVLGAFDSPLSDRFLAQADDGGLWRTGRPDHLTVSCLVISDDLSQVLLTLHAKAARWFQFGGHLEDGDESLVAGARREVAEESGLASFNLDPDVAQLDVHWVEFCGEGVHHLDVRFVAQADSADAYSISEESHDVRWFPLTGLPELEDSVLDLIDIAIDRFATARAR
jgi:8-oxo-dGTP pyrophosphatase MutT (NUDIX family)